MFGGAFRLLSVGTSGKAVQRFVSTSNVRLAKTNLYTVLGLTPKATQSDIKKAYYKLSMQHHPDKNKGSELAVQKFREITEAYEVLGSYKSRKRYDQGMIHKSYSNDPQASASAEEEEEDDPQTKFYKQHMKRDRAPPPTGSTPIYDFDEWSRAHYGKNFDRRQAAKKKYERIKKAEGNTQVRNIELSVLFVCTFVCCMVVFSKWDQSSYDSVKEEEPAPTSNPNPSSPTNN